MNTSLVTWLGVSSRVRQQDAFHHAPLYFVPSGAQDVEVDHFGAFVHKVVRLEEHLVIKVVVLFLQDL